MLIGITHEIRAIAGCCPAVTDLAESPVLTDEKSQRIRLWAAVVEPARFLLLAHEAGIPNFRRDEVFVPLEQVADRRQQSAVPVDVFKRHVHPEFAGVSLGIGNCAVPDDSCKIVAP